MRRRFPNHHPGKDSGNPGQTQKGSRFLSGIHQNRGHRKDHTGYGKMRAPEEAFP